MSAADQGGYAGMGTDQLRDLVGRPELSAEQRDQVRRELSQRGVDPGWSPLDPEATTTMADRPNPTTVMPQSPSAGVPGNPPYPAAPGYPAQGGYPAQSGYPAQGGYPAQSGYPAQGGYPGSGGYPAQGAQQPAYPGQQPAYPGQQPAYPGQQPAYPSQQPAYPGQQPAYPSQQPAYPSPQPAQPGQPSVLPAHYPYAGPQLPTSMPRTRSRVGWVVGGVAVVVVVLIAVVALIIGLMSGGSDSTGAGRPTATDGPLFPVPSAGPDDGSGGDSGGRTGPTGAAWTVPINAYCRSVDPELKRAANSLPQRVPVLRRMNSHLRSMSVPSSTRPTYLRMVTYWEQAAEAWNSQATAAAKGDTAAERSAAQTASLNNLKGNIVAQGLGLPDCAGAGSL